MPRWQNLAIALASKASVRKDFSVQIRALALRFIKLNPLSAIIKMKKLNILLLIIILLIIIFGLALISINSCEKGQSKWSKGKHFTGKMYSFKVSHDKMNFDYPAKKVSERYDNKYFDYLEGMHKSRDKTFMKGKVFLTESK